MWTGLSTRTLNHLAGLIRRHRDQRRSRWRRLDPGRQALLALAHLRNGDTYTRLASGFEITGLGTWRADEIPATLPAQAWQPLSCGPGGERRPLLRLGSARPDPAARHPGRRLLVAADPPPPPPPPPW